MAITVVFADDHPMLLSGMSYICSTTPDLIVGGLAQNSTEIFELLKHTVCDVLVTDYSMPGGRFGDGLGMLAAVKRNFPAVKIIVLTSIDNPSILHEIGRLDVKVLSKRAGVSRIIETIRATHLETMPPAQACDDDAEDDGLTDRARLSPREIEVVRLFVEGFSVSQIASQLHRTPQTVGSQKVSAMKKLDLRCDAELFRFAHQAGMLRGRGAASAAMA